MLQSHIDYIARVGSKRFINTYFMNSFVSIILNSIVISVFLYPNLTSPQSFHILLTHTSFILSNNHITTTALMPCVVIIS